MTQPVILGVGTGVPSRRFAQSELYERFLEPHFGRNRLARTIFAHAGIDYRHVAVEGDYYDEERTTEARNERYLAEALPLGATTIERCLTNARLRPEDVDDFLVVSCTGWDVPGLDLRLAAQLGMRSDLRRTCVFGMGCYGAFPALERAREAVLAQPGRTALVLALELCSLHLQFDDSLENIVASALFADGASSVVVGNGSERASGPRLIDAATFCDYQTFDHMAFHLTDHGFRMRLSAYVPDVLAANVGDLVQRLLAPHDLTVPDIRFWAVHPGSSKILDYIQDRLGLAQTQLDFSRTVLREFGNMSSATIFFVLDEILRGGQPHVGDYGVMMAFGPGLTLETALVQWQ